jgi:hypothetical protein
MSSTTKNEKSTGKKPNLRIVDAEDLTTVASGQQHRSQLVQHLLRLSEEIEADIERIMKL